MAFKKYMHIEKFGTTETEGIDIGECYIFPKIDGTNGSVWTDESGVKAASRKRELTLDSDNHGFFKWVLKQENIYQLLNTYPDIRLFGEFLVPHTVQYYKDDAWNQFYVFDVWDDERLKYIHYNEYQPILEHFGIEYIPPLAIIKNPSYMRLVHLMNVNKYLIPDNVDDPGEGIVIKNYDWVNKFGRQVWAKLVRNDFKTEKSKKEPTDIKEKRIIEEEIVEQFVTFALVDKEYYKIKNEVGWTSKQIPRLLNTVFYCLVKEESWNFVKKFKNPRIDFKRLQQFTFKKVKELKPELF